MVGSPMGFLVADYAPSESLTTTVLLRTVGGSAATGRIEVSTIRPDWVVLSLIIPVGRLASSTGRFPSSASTTLVAIMATAITVASLAIITDESLFQGGRGEYIPVYVGRVAGVQHITSQNLGEERVRLWVG